MAENSKIEWTHHTFNPWYGCTKISPACDNCYAADWDKRYNKESHWGPKAPRERTSKKNWQLPRKWDDEASAAGIRYRVFCASLADVFDNQVPELWRDDLWNLIAATPNLDWLLLTKRPQNIKSMYPLLWQEKAPHNVWLGTTVENQQVADRNIAHLLEVPAVVHFLSCEPLLEKIDLTKCALARFKHERKGADMVSINSPHAVDSTVSGVLNALTGKAYARVEYDEEFSDTGIRINALDWVIAGGESGPGYREAEEEWFLSLRDQCIAAGVPFLFKQWSGKNQKVIKEKGRLLDGKEWSQYPIPRGAK